MCPLIWFQLGASEEDEMLRPEFAFMNEQDRLYESYFWFDVLC
jgi:hypothetical protein